MKKLTLLLLFLFAFQSQAQEKVKEGEIDFIATNGEEKIYFQVAYLLDGKETEKREFGAYKEISDNYPKYILSLDKTNFSKDGIIHKNIIDWLLEK